MSYHRIMLKLSGEALGENGWLFDHEKIMAVAEVIKDVANGGTQVGIVIGGGNLWRGRTGAANGMDAVRADQMGMLGTVMNSIVMQDALIRAGQPAEVFSALPVHSVCQAYLRDAADEALNEKGVALFAGGLGNPFFTTDTAVVLRAVELKADALLLAKNVNGVYTDDPNTDKDAKLIADISYREAIALNLQVMDLAAFKLCADQALPQVRVFGLDHPDNIKRVLAGEALGTVLHP
ncbi:MAG: UMP kinase [Eubacteriales bacterium]|nr:UMP kinase [Eubacteriales bacterium]